MTAVAIIMLACLLLTAGCRRAGEIRIGFLGSDLTDDGSEQMALLGADLAVSEINSSGGVFARTLTIVRASYHGDRQAAVEEATRLSTDEKVAAIVGVLPTAIMRVVSPVSQTNRVVTVSTGAIGKGVEGAGDCIFRVISGEDATAPPVSQFLISGCGWKKFVLVGDAAEVGAQYVLDLYKAALSKNGAQIVTSLTVDTSGLERQLTALAGKEFNAIVFAGTPATAAAFIRAARSRGVAQPVYVAGAGNDSLLLDASVDTEGIVVAVGADPGKPAEEWHKFHAGFVARYGREPDAAAARGYDAVKLIVRAMLEARGTKTDLYVPALAGTSDWAGASGNLSYTAGTRQPVYEPLYLLNLDHGKPVLMATLSQTTK